MNREICTTTLDNGVLRAELISFGAALRSLVYRGVDICLGYESLEDYASMDSYLGACVGRCANRIAGGKFSLGGHEFLLSRNEGENHLHGGFEGFSHRIWQVCSSGRNEARFSLVSPDGDQGYPGELSVCVTYRLEGASLIIEYSAVSSRDTVVSLTNHTYFNLSGHDSGDIGGHILQLGSKHFTPCDAENIPTGEIRSCRGSALDFSSPALLRPRLDELANTPTAGLDHNFVLEACPAARLYSPETGIEMQLETSLPGLQVYSAGYLSRRRGKNGAVYAPRHALCLEPQYFPNAVNRPGFASPVLRKGQEYHHFAKYSFSVRGTESSNTSRLFCSPFYAKGIV